MTAGLADHCSPPGDSRQCVTGVLAFQDGMWVIVLMASVRTLASLQRGRVCSPESAIPVINAQNRETARLKAALAALQKTFGKPTKTPANSSVPPSPAIRPGAAAEPIRPKKRFHTGAHRALCRNPTAVTDMQTDTGPHCAADVCGAEQSEGAMTSMFRSAAQAFAGHAQTIRKRLPAGTMIGSNKIILRTGTEIWWLRVFQHANGSFFTVAPSRGKDVVSRFLGDARPSARPDFGPSGISEQPGWGLPVCLAHPLRDTHMMQLTMATPFRPRWISSRPTPRRSLYCDAASFFAR